MKKMISMISILVSLSALADDSYLFECNAKAIEAAKAIDELNFELSDRSSVVIKEQVQKKNTAKINVSFSESKNRNYTIRLSKNRSVTLRGDSVSEQTGCTVDSVSAN